MNSHGESHQLRDLLPILLAYACHVDAPVVPTPHLQALMSAVTPPADRSQNQYQHAIPRFILRNFQAHPVEYKNKKERLKVTRKALKKGKEVDPIFYYDVNTGIVSTPSIARCYGKINLYRDDQNPEDVNHLEVKLSCIEQSAAAVIRTIQTKASLGHFTITREELSTLRKFLFLMHYRQDAMSSAYFQEDVPQNAPLAQWIRKYKEKHQLATVGDIWRHGLKYYLDTPHQAIVTAGEKIRERYGADKFYEMLQKGVDPDLEEEWFAVDYERQANRYFLGVWEAAPGTEFVLGRNGFGLWEGRVRGVLGAHKIYIMSPQIAIVLRDTVLHREAAYDPSVLTSCIAHIDINAPAIQYFADKMITQKMADGEWTLAARFEYRRSPEAQKDQFTIPVTRLDDVETYAVNEIVMMNANVHLDGAITYCSPHAMLKTLERYMTAQNTFVGLKKGLYRPLLQELLKMDFTSLSSDVQQPPTPYSFDIWDPDIYSDSETDMQLSLLLRMIVVSGGVEFSSTYNRAYLVYHMATVASSLANPVTREIRGMVKEAIEKLSPNTVTQIDNPSLTSSRRVGSLPTPPPSPTHTSPSRRLPSEQVTLLSHQSSTLAQGTKMILVDSLGKVDSDLFFARFGTEVDKLEVGEYTNDLLNNIIYEAAMIGIAQWMAETRPDVLSTFFKPLLRAAEIW